MTCLDGRMHALKRVAPIRKDMLDEVCGTIGDRSVCIEGSKMPQMIHKMIHVTPNFYCSYRSNMHYRAMQLQAGCDPKAETGPHAWKAGARNIVRVFINLAGPLLQAKVRRVLSRNMSRSTNGSHHNYSFMLPSHLLIENNCRTDLVMPGPCVNHHDNVLLYILSTVTSLIHAPFVVSLFTL